ncbi:hypothetical protein D7I44_16695 [Gryllotalpicola protaetiae]|uniref:Uncharacterized protein n=1 Tax=Gryllotalpicola protaetiae TaxID=2419771 RepID=A0A387BSE8_9MICO|nr:hypothetical protein D7I44_16695 [Gryllotalpicola protaetiae]
MSTRAAATISHNEFKLLVIASVVAVVRTDMTSGTSLFGLLGLGQFREKRFHVLSKCVSTSLR